MSRPPCPECGRTNCPWRDGTWKAAWLTHDPDSFIAWVNWKAQK